MPKTYVEGRVAQYGGDLGQLVGHELPHFRRIPLGSILVPKWGMQLQEKPDNYILMVSKSDTPNPGYNVILTVHGSNSDRVSALMSDLVQRTGLPVQPLPDELRRVWTEDLPRLARIIEGMFRSS